MDELISKLRSQVGETQKEVQESSQSDVVVLKNENEIHDLTTSQSDLLPKNRFKLDFDILRKYRPEKSMKIVDLKECDSFKIDEPVWAIIKSIECFKGLNGCVYRWEIIDESGVIFGSSNVADQNVSVGSVVCLCNFSIWKFGGNHLNIVSRNIKQVIN